MRKILFTSGVVLGVASGLMAGPPVPSFSIYGSVRDVDGRPLASGEAYLSVLNSAELEITRTPSDPAIGTGINYELAMPMDSGIDGERYKPNSLRTGEAFSVRVLIDNESYVPSAAGVASFAAGTPGTASKYDLTLGEDTDKDGLPDDWERAYLLDNVQFTDISQINPGDDPDGDGLTNFQEFLAGTNPFDPSSLVEFEIVNKRNGYVQLSFPAERGRSYLFMSSVNLKDWAVQRVAMKPGDQNLAGLLLAADSETLSVYVPLIPGTRELFFRLHVQ